MLREKTRRIRRAIFYWRHTGHAAVIGGKNGSMTCEGCQAVWGRR